jgi:hypothetical protein
MLARENLRASHEDRDQVVEQLRVAGGDGRLEPEELTQRVEAALTARTYGQLAALVADLPAGSGSAARPKDLVRIEVGGGNAARNGRWSVPQRMEVKIRSGDVKLDFTEAQVTWPILQIEAEVRSGNLTLITKPGIVVDTDDVAVRSGDVKVKAPWGSTVPVTLRIEVSGQVGSGDITARPPRRSFWAWLRREPAPTRCLKVLPWPMTWSRTRPGVSAGPGEPAGLTRGPGPGRRAVAGGGRGRPAGPRGA